MNTKVMKLNPTKVREMRRYYNQGYSTRDIAAWYDVSSKGVWQVVTFRAWKGVK